VTIALVVFCLFIPLERVEVLGGFSILAVHSSLQTGFVFNKANIIEVAQSSSSQYS